MDSSEGSSVGVGFSSLYSELVPCSQALNLHAFPASNSAATVQLELAVHSIAAKLSIAYDLTTVPLVWYQLAIVNVLAILQQRTVTPRLIIYNAAQFYAPALWVR